MIFPSSKQGSQIQETMLMFGGEIAPTKFDKTQTELRSPLYQITIDLNDRGPCKVSIDLVLQNDRKPITIHGTPFFSQNLPNKRKVGNVWLFIDSQGGAHTYNEVTHAVGYESLKNIDP